MAPFICNNFYQNIISPYTVDEKLLYVIAILLKEEINKLNSVEQINEFLDKTSCEYLLSELKKKSDIQTFSKTCIYKVIEKIEVKCSEKKLNLNLTNLVNDTNKIMEKLKNKTEGRNTFEDLIYLSNINIALGGNDDDEHINFETFKMRKKKETDNFNKKYASNLTKNELEKLVIKFGNEKKMKDYIIKQINKCNNDVYIFTNESLINNIYNSQYSNILFFLYQMDFLKIIKIIDLLIETFKENIKILPKSLKYICKIISILIKTKFPNIKSVEENAFISRFLFINLLIPIFKNPIEIYFNDFIISENSLYNLRYILKIFIQLILGNFYMNKENQFHFTPFNWYFIEKMPIIL